MTKAVSRISETLASAALLVGIAYWPLKGGHQFGEVCRGNGGWSSHKRACAAWQAAVAARRTT